MVRLKFFDIVKYENIVDDIIHISACDLKKNKKVKSTIHWLSVDHSIPAKFIFINENNPLIKNIYEGFIEKYVVECDEETVFEFERIGYFKLLHKDANNIPHYLCIIRLHN